MGLLKIEGITHWSIPVNNLDESESCTVIFSVLSRWVGSAIRACLASMSRTKISYSASARLTSTKRTWKKPNVHHSFTVTPETLVQACKVFSEKKVPIDRLYYRAKGFFTGRELYFFDPSGNRLELRDPTWKAACQVNF